MQTMRSRRPSGGCWRSLPSAKHRPCLAECDLLRGLSPVQCEAVVERLDRTMLQAGQLLFRRGDVGDRLYVLTEGSVSIVNAADASGRRQRFVSFSAGRMFGELAVLDGAGRTADAVADIDSVLWALTPEAISALDVIDHGLAAALYRNIAVHLSERLRAASAAWRHGAS